MTDKGIEYPGKIVPVPENERTATNAYLEEPVRGIRVGDDVWVFEVPGAPESLRGKRGTVTAIDDRGQLHGTWDPEWTLIPGVDLFEKVSDLKAEYIRKHPEKVEGMFPMSEPDTVAKRLFYEELRKGTETAYYRDFEDYITERLDRQEVLMSSLYELIAEMKKQMNAQNRILESIGRQMEKGVETLTESIDSINRAVKRCAQTAETTQQTADRIRKDVHDMSEGVTVTGWKTHDGVKVI